MKIKLYQYSEYNYLHLHILFPILEINSVYKDCIGEDNYFTGIELNTKCNYIRSNIGWSFSFMLLGFGITLNRQYNY